MISYYKKSIKDKKLKELEIFKNGSWINVINPNKDELEFLSKTFNLSPEMLEDGLDENELPRLDFEEDSHYIYFNTISNSNDLVTFLIIVGENFLLTLCKKENKLIDFIQNKKFNFITTQKKKSTISLLYINNDLLEKLVTSTVKMVQSKKNTSHNLNDNDLNSLLNHEELLNTLASTYTYTLHLYNKMIKQMNFLENDLDYLKDLIIESEEGLDVCVRSLKTISNLRNYYSLVISNRLNKTITVLTVFTILISIATSISGLYGMNVNLPFQNASYIFYYILFFMGLIMLFFFIILKKKKII